MAGHSQFKNIMYRKGAQDKKRGKIFTKIIREIMIAVKEAGSIPDSNPRLRSALISAREANMPKDNVERAIKRAAGGDETADYSEVRYEGYGPGGIALIVETLTDNKNRTAAEVRSAFTKFGGNLGESGSVSFQFERLGQIAYPRDIAAFESVFEAALEAGASDVEEVDDEYHLYCVPEDLASTRDMLSGRFGDPKVAKLIWKPKNTIKIEGDSAKTLLKLMEILEENDDVQELYANFEMDDDVLNAFES